jgi:hypothetical protein
VRRFSILRFPREERNAGRKRLKEIGFSSSRIEAGISLLCDRCFVLQSFCWGLQDDLHAAGLVARQISGTAGPSWDLMYRTGRQAASTGVREDGKADLDRAGANIMFNGEYACGRV